MISGHLTYCLMSISRYVIVKFGHDSKWVAILRKLLLPSQLLVLIYYFTVRAIVDKYVRSLNGTQEVNNFQKDIIQYIHVSKMKHFFLVLFVWRNISRHINNHLFGNFPTDCFCINHRSYMRSFNLPLREKQLLCRQFQPITSE